MTVPLKVVGLRVYGKDLALFALAPRRRTSPTSTGSAFDYALG